MSKLKKLLVNTFSSGGKNTQSSNSSMDTAATVSFEHTSIQSRRFDNARILHNGPLIWLDDNIDEVNDIDCRNTTVLLRRIFNSVDIYTNSEQCIASLNRINDEKVFMIISGKLGKHVVPIIHDLVQVDSIYIFCMNKLKHEQWAKEWFKIRGVFTDISSVYDALEVVTREAERDAISISYVSTSSELPNQNLDQINQSFMYTQILKEILLTISFKQSDFKEFIDYCRQLYTDQHEELKMIDELKQTYRKKSPIWWYTRECFLYQMLNRAFRLMEFDTIVKMGFYVQELHQQIKQLYSKQMIDQQFRQPFIVYRGQRLSKNDFAQMLKSKGGLLSFNSFVSTSTDSRVSMTFAKDALRNEASIGILFVMTIDSSISSAPFASVSNISFFQKENEILFSMHTVFRIHNIKSISENKRLWQVELIQTSDNDLELCALTKHMRGETKGSTGWDSLGRFLIKLGQSNKAQQLYTAMLKKTSDDYDKANIYNQLGWTKDKHGEYSESILFYEKALEIVRKTRPENLLDLASSYNNIGVIHNRRGDYPNALVAFEKALEIRQKIFHPSHPDLADSYNNLGLLYKNMGDHAKALVSLEKALAIRQKKSSF